MIDHSPFPHHNRPDIHSRRKWVSTGKLFKIFYFIGNKYKYKYVSDPDDRKCQLMSYFKHSYFLCKCHQIIRILILYFVRNDPCEIIYTTICCSNTAVWKRNGGSAAVFRNCVLVILVVCVLVLLFLAIYILPTNQDRMKAWKKIVTDKWGQWGPSGWQIIVDNN